MASVGKHPNIVNLIGACSEGGMLLIVVHFISFFFFLLPLLLLGIFRFLHCMVLSTD